MFDFGLHRHCSNSWPLYANPLINEAEGTGRREDGGGEAHVYTVTVYRARREMEGEETGDN
jgi:hypothetical protein